MSDNEIPQATVETRTEWVCPCCGTFAPSFGATNPLAGPPYTYRCHDCNGLFVAPEEET